MKCEFCGADLSLEAEVCPHCGQPNRHAQQHIRDMKRYHGEFENTKKGVYTATKKYTEVTVRAIIIAVLVVVIGLLAVLYNGVYDIHRNIVRSNARRNVVKYSEILDTYLEEENFREFHDFCDAKGLSYYFSEGEYNEYKPLMTTTYYYLYFSEKMMNMASDDELRDSDLEFLCEYMNSFYESCDLEKYIRYTNGDRQENLDAVAVMQSDVERMLQTYCGLTEEEAASLKDLSDARRTVLIEEKMENDQ